MCPAPSNPSPPPAAHPKLVKMREKLFVATTWREYIYITKWIFVLNFEKLYRRFQVIFEFSRKWRRARVFRSKKRKRNPPPPQHCSLEKQVFQIYRGQLPTQFLYNTFKEEVSTGPVLDPVAYPGGGGGRNPPNFRKIENFDRV